MSNSQLRKISLLIVKICFYATLLAPLILTAAFFFPAIFPKTVFFRLAVELALVFYVPLALADKRFRPAGHIIYWSIALFAAVVFVASLAGLNWHYSFWGNYERMDGIFTWLHYWIFILMLGSVLRTKAEWRNFFTTSLIVAALVGSYGLLQYYGVDNFGPIKIYETQAGRVQGTIANPGFLAAYMLFHLALALLLAVDTEAKKSQRIFGGLALVYLFPIFILSGVRGAFIGLLLSLVFFGLGYLLWHKRHARGYKLGLALTAAFFLVVSLLVIFRQSDFIAHNKIFGRLFNINLSDSTAQSRLIAWRGILPAIKDNFWLGVGPQKFDWVFNSYFDPKFYTAIGGESWWDRAHNMPLEVLATMGVLGLAAYLLVGLAVFYSLWRIGKNQDKFKIEALILMALFLAYFVQNLFVFDSINTYLMLSLTMAYVAARSLELASAPRFNWLDRAAAKWWHYPVPVVNRIWLPLIIVFSLLAAVAYAGNLKLVKHNRLLLKTLSYQGQWPFTMTLDSYRKIFVLSDFDQRETAIKLGAWLSQYGLSKSIAQLDFEAGYRVLTANMEKARRQNPQDVRLLLSYGNALNVYGELAAKVDKNFSQSILQKAAKVFQEAIKLGPGRQQIYFSLANTYLIGGDTARGIEILEKAAGLNADNSMTYWLLAFAYTQAGDKDKARAAANEALDKNYSFTNENEANQMAQVYLDKKDYDGLLRLYKRVAADVHTGTSQARVAALYAQLGRKEEAVAVAREVIKLDPSLREQVEEFIRQVESGAKTDFLK